VLLREHDPNQEFLRAGNFGKPRVINGAQISAIFRNELPGRADVLPSGEIAMLHKMVMHGDGIRSSGIVGDYDALIAGMSPHAEYPRRIAQDRLHAIGMVHGMLAYDFQFECLRLVRYFW
jgi:hypothetical protein